MASVMPHRNGTVLWCTCVLSMPMPKLESCLSLQEHVRCQGQHSIYPLCGARHLAQLFRATAADLDVDISVQFAWTDSTVVLGWLGMSTSKLKVFVAHRVMDILHQLPRSCWRHVHTHENPAARGQVFSVVRRTTLAYAVAK